MEMEIGKALRDTLQALGRLDNIRAAYKTLDEEYSQCKDNGCSWATELAFFHTSDMLMRQEDNEIAAFHRAWTDLTDSVMGADIGFDPVALEKGRHVKRIRDMILDVLLDTFGEDFDGGRMG